MTDPSRATGYCSAQIASFATVYTSGVDVSLQSRMGASDVFARMRGIPLKLWREWENLMQPSSSTHLQAFVECGRLKIQVYA